MKAIFFDLDGTLLHYTREYNAILTDAIKAVKGDVCEDWIETYNAAFFEILMECGAEPYRQAFATIGDDPDTGALVEALREQEVKACQPPQDAQSDLARLSEEYNLGVLTNGVQEWQKHKLQAHNLERYFDAVITAYDAGAHKPDPRPFRLAEKRLPADDYAMTEMTRLISRAHKEQVGYHTNTREMASAIFLIPLSGTESSIQSPV